MSTHHNVEHEHSEFASLIRVNIVGQNPIARLVMAEVPADNSHDVAAELLVSELVFDILSNVASFLPREDLVTVFCVRKFTAGREARLSVCQDDISFS
jgi:hypothetical protein